MANGRLHDPLANTGSESDSVRRHVQSACTAGLTGIARATIAGDVGYWYFRRGAIIHALTLELVGDEAALRMLSWEGCRWEPCARPWPSERSVFLSWVELFQRAGELPRAAVASATFPASAAPPALASKQPPPQSISIAPAPPRLPQPSQPPLSPSQIESLAAAAIDFTVIEADGSSRVLRGESEALAELVTFALQLSNELGSAIALGRCLAVEVAYPEHSLLVASNGPHTLGLTIPRCGELDRVKAKLRL